MRPLRFVGPGDDVDHVVVETFDGAEQFSLLVNEALRGALQSDLPRLSGLRKANDSQVSPREIQVRVRAGEDPEALASDLDISLDRVMIFARAVLQERSQVTGEARRGRARRSTPDGQLVEFGPAVDERFAAHGIDVEAVRWDAHRREDGQWVVSASWRGGDSERCADWVFNLAGRMVTPLDETAADLLSDRPIRPVVQVVPPPAPEAPTATTPVSADALTGPMPALDAEALFGLDANLEESADVDDEAEPPLPLRLAEPVTPPSRPADADPEEKAARARIPSWDDILLGVRRKRD